MDHNGMGVIEIIAVWLILMILLIAFRETVVDWILWLYGMAGSCI